MMASMPSSALPAPTCPAEDSGQALRVIHADDTLLVVSKPAGLLAVPGRGADKQDCLASRVQAMHPEALIVHRLDQPTSGLMLLARNPLAQRHLGALFESRQMHKRYVAVVQGQPAGEQGEIDWPLMANWPNRPMQKVDLAQGKPALTRWRVLSRNEPGQRTRLELAPETGRTHQLRVHLKAWGHPIAGDTLYGSESPDTAPQRLLLHAWTLAFTHPATELAVTFEDPVPF
jgi:tRNA pseudouridine32 synthase/23S rRNA pseudouridine746 synthase